MENTIQVQFNPAVEEQLRKKAQQAGVSLESYVQNLAERDVRDSLEAAVLRLTTRSAEQILADRERLAETARPGRPLPEGQTLLEAVEGTWPGTETDEEVREQLKRLS